MTLHRANRSHMVANPGEVMGATHPGPPETRESHDSTGGMELARFLTRRNFLRGAAGATALFFGAGAVAILRDGPDDTRAEEREQTNPNTLAPAFEKDLALRHMAMPETLELPTFGDVVAAVGEGVQYSVNFNNPALHQFIPGGAAHALQPGQFALRAALIEGYRRSSEGTAMDKPDDPNDARYYAWGFEMELIELLNQVGKLPGDPNVNTFIANVHITMGDLPPLITQATLDFPPRERPQEFTAEVMFSRYAGLTKNGAYIDLPNVGGQPGRGWGISSTSGMVPLAPELTRYLPNGYTEVPPLFQKPF